MSEFALFNDVLTRNSGEVDSGRVYVAFRSDGCVTFRNELRNQFIFLYPNQVKQLKALFKKRVKGVVKRLD